MNNDNQLHIQTVLRGWLAVAGILAMLSVSMAWPAFAEDGPALDVYDTGTPAAQALPGDLLARRAGWTKIAEGQKAAAFKGDAVLANTRFAAVARWQGGGIEIYGRADGQAWAARGRLVPVGTSPWSLKAARVIQQDEAGATLELTYAGPSGTPAVVSAALDAMQPILRTQPVSGMAGLRVESSSRLGVMPDFFADDMVIDARVIPVERTELPSEHFFMQMLGGGDAILTAIWDKNQRDVEITLAGEKDARQITGVEIFYGEGGSIWIAALETKGLWTTFEITPENVKNVASLDWKVPFRAKWKGNFVRTDHTVDSWEFAYLTGSTMPGKSSRWRWSGVVGGYDWPCWFDVKGDDLKPGIQAATKFPNGNFAGPFVVYPIGRTPDTPLNRMTVTDLMLNSLGVGPCEYIMDTAGAGVSDKGITTCAVNAMVLAIFADSRQKEERVMMDRMFREVQVFIKAIGDRINGYVEFRSEMLKYLTEQKVAHPELADFIGRLEKQTIAIHKERVDRSAPVASLIAQIKAEAVSDTPRTDIDRLTGDGHGLVAHGGWQDNVVARCRNSVKILRQMATIEMAINPKSAEVAKEIRKRTQQALRNPLGHEMR